MKLILFAVCSIAIVSCSERTEEINNLTDRIWFNEKPCSNCLPSYFYLNSEDSIQYVWANHEFIMKDITYPSFAPSAIEASDTSGDGPYWHRRNLFSIHKNIVFTQSLIRGKIDATVYRTEILDVSDTTIGLIPGFKMRFRADSVEYLYVSFKNQSKRY